MKYIKNLLLLILVFSAINISAQPKVDSLSIRIKQLEKSLDKINTISEKVDAIDSKLDTKTNNILTDNGNILTYLSIVLGIIAVIFGIQYYFQNQEAKEVKKETKDLIKETKSDATSVLLDVRKTKNEIEDLKNKLIEETKFVSVVKAEIEDYKSEIITLKKSYERDKLNIPEYSDACEKLEEGSIDQALEKYNGIIQRDPNFYKAYSKIPMCYSSLWENQKASELINELVTKIHTLNSIQKNSSNENALIEANASKGVILRRLTKYDDAIKAFRQLIKNEGTSDEDQLKKSTYTHIGYCLLYKKEYTEALKYFEKARSKDKSSPSYYGIVKAFFLKDKKVDKQIIDDAIAISKKDLLENPKYPYHNFGAAFLALINSILSNEDSNSFKTYLDTALVKCRNLGIMKEQLFEYELVKNETDINNDNINYAIKTLSIKIEEISKTLKDSQEVIDKNR